MARVTVRAFGALREVLGSATEHEATDVAALVEALCDQHGAELRRRLARATVAIGDEPVTVADARPLQDGDVVVLLPPFAGGAADD